jgi:hypothetical protein
MAVPDVALEDVEKYCDWILKLTRPATDDDDSTTPFQ